MALHIRGADRARQAALWLLLALAPWVGGATMASKETGFAMPDPSLEGSVPVERALAQRRSVRKFAPEPLALATVSQLLWAAQGITHPDGLRTAPSAGALYPLELYLLVGAVSGIQPGVYRYEPAGHRLILEREGDRRGDVAKASFGQDWVAEAPAILAIAAVYQRTARKYGDRAQRYVHMEAGHAAQNVYLQAGALGLGTTMVGAFHDEKLARALGLPGPAKPLALLPVGKPH